MDNIVCNGCVSYSSAPLRGAAILEDVARYDTCMRGEQGGGARRRGVGKKLLINSIYTVRAYLKPELCQKFLIQYPFPIYYVSAFQSTAEGRAEAKRNHPGRPRRPGNQTLAEPMRSTVGGYPWVEGIHGWRDPLQFSYAKTDDSGLPGDVMEETISKIGASRRRRNNPRPLR